MFVELPLASGGASCSSAGLTIRARERSTQGEFAVRLVYIALIVVFTALVLLFKFQNLDMVTVSLFSANISLPVSVLIVVIYVLGMLTGGFLLALLRTLVHRASRP